VIGIAIPPQINVSCVRCAAAVPEKTIETAMAAIARTNTRRMFSPPLWTPGTALTGRHHEGQVYEPARNLAALTESA
jgi:hypothetical protein